MKKISLLVSCMLLYSSMLAETDPLERKIRRDADIAVALLFPTAKSQGNKDNNDSPSHGILATSLLAARNAIYHYLGVLPWESPVSTRDTDPFTYNLNPCGKYLKAFLQKNLEQKTLDYIHKMKDIVKVVCDDDVTASIKEADAVCQAVIGDIPDHFELLFDPATGILN